MQQIEAAIGQDKRFACGTPFGGTLPQLLAAEDFSSNDFLPAQCGLVAGRDCSMAYNKAGGDTVAVHRFIAAVPPADVASAAAYSRRAQLASPAVMVALKVSHAPGTPFSRPAP